MPIKKNVSAEEMARDLLVGPLQRQRYASTTLDRVADWLRSYPDHRVKECEARVHRRDRRIRHLEAVIHSMKKGERTLV